MRSVTASGMGRRDAIALRYGMLSWTSSEQHGPPSKIGRDPGQGRGRSYGIAATSNQAQRDQLVAETDAALRAMVKDGSWQKAAADMGSRSDTRPTRP